MQVILTRIDPSQIEFIDQTFKGIDGRALDLEGRLFEDCTFLNCVFAETNFSKTRFIDCTFCDCDLSNAGFVGASLHDPTFKSSKLVGINWTQATSVNHLKFEKCILSYCIFIGLDLRKSVFRDCIAKETDFMEANLSEADLRGTDLIAARFANTNLTKADLRQAINYSIGPLENKLNKARFALPEATLLLRGLGIELEE